MRIRLKVSYDGTNYKGFQRQKDLITVQGELENALEHILAERVTIHPAGRTDGGVHAFGQIVHFDTSAKRELSAFVKGVNHFLPDDIRVIEAEHAPDDFHSRKSPHETTYIYKMYVAPHIDALRHNRAWYVGENIDIDAMREALRYFVGVHDFATFRTMGSTATSTIREVKSAELKLSGDEIILEITANGFLYNMVRIIEACLCKVGQHLLPPDIVPSLLTARSRSMMRAIAPAYGLYLQSIKYL